MVEFRLLGAVEVRNASHQIHIGPPQRRAVLAALLVDVGRPIRPETLVDRVWDEDPPDGARRALHAHITRIRGMLSEAGVAGGVINRAGVYYVDIDANLVDWHRFHGLVAAAGQHADAERSGMLRRALDLWCGTPLADVPGAWASQTREHWRQLRLDAAVSWAEAVLRLGRHDAVIGPLRDLLAEYPLAEALVAALLRALVAAGRPAEALDCYARCRAALIEQLGAEPGPALQTLHRAILRGDPPEPATVGGRDGAAIGAVDGVGPVPAQLPPDVRGFAGRDAELAHLDRVLDSAGRDPTAVIVSAVSGTAGVGKTALVLHWAHRVTVRFPDGQLYANLHGFSADRPAMDASHVVTGFLYALGVPPERIPSGLEARVALYRSRLNGLRILVVLDNARDAEQVRPLLPGTATATVVVTSRNQLTGLVAADGAHLLTLGLMSASEAQELLRRRLGAERVAAEPEAVEQIVDACARLPLALVIAAARALETGFRLAVLAGELRIAGRSLDVLDAGDVMSRMRAVFAGSYSALSAPAARLFRLLGLHPGPDIDTTAACALAGTDATRLRPAMTELTSAHLVLEHRPGRYTFHDLLREYAAELVRTAEDDAQRRAAERRMLDHYVHSAHAAARRLDPSRPPRPLGPAGAAQPAPYRTHEQAMAWFEAEHPVLLGVISYAAVCGHDAETTHLAWSLVDFVSRRGHWRDWLNTQTLALQAARRLGDLGEQASTHMCLARAYTTHGEHDEALVQLRQALGLAERLGDRTRQAHIHINISIVFDYQHRYAEALRHDYEALEHYAAAGHAEGRAYSLNNIGCCLTNLGRPADALAAAEQAMILVRDGEHHELIAAVWDTLGYAHYHLHDHARAVDCYEHALALYRDIGDRYEEAKTLVHLGDAHHAAGESGVARAVWQQALIVLTELDHPDAETLRAKMAQPLVS